MPNRQLPDTQDPSRKGGSLQDLAGTTDQNLDDELVENEDSDDDEIDAIEDGEEEEGSGGHV